MNADMKTGQKTFEFKKKMESDIRISAKITNVSKTYNKILQQNLKIR